MKLELHKKNLIWKVLYGFSLIIGSQVLAFYLYKNLNHSVNRFIELKIDNKRIEEINELQYTPGKGTYKVLKISYNNYIPLFIENQQQFEDSIKINQFINKKPNSKYFEIKNGDQIKEYQIRTLASQQNFMRIYLFAIALLVAIGVFFKYNITLKK
jgi:hypothetical protein